MPYILLHTEWDDHIVTTDALGNVTSIVHQSTTPINATAMDHIEAGIYSGSSRTYDLVADGKCVGNGTTDDTTAFAAAITAAGANYVLTSPPGKTYLVSAALTVPTTGAHWDLRGATIRMADGSAFNMLSVSASGVTLENFTIDGRRAYSSTRGAGLVVNPTTSLTLPTYVRNVTVKDCGLVGVSVGTYTSVFDCYMDNVTSQNSKDPLNINNASGFNVGINGRAHFNNCKAIGNDKDGFRIASDAPAGVTFTGGCYAKGNSLGGFSFWNTTGGQADILVAYDNKVNGVRLEGAQKWSIGVALVSETGEAIGGNYPDGSGVYYDGAHVALVGATRNSIGSVQGRKGGGYGLVIAGASLQNDFGSVFIEQIAAVNGNPGIHFSGASCKNHIVTASVRNEQSVALIFGEDAVGSNDDNMIDNVFTYNCLYGALRITKGKRNHIGRIVARDTYTTDATYSGLLDFATTGCADNIVGFIDHYSSDAATAKPKYVIRCDADAVRNYVLDGISRSESGNPYVTAELLDSNTGNFVSPALATAGTLRP